MPIVVTWPSCGTRDRYDARSRGIDAPAGVPMKVLVYPHDLSIGGSQLNAIEIAAKVASLGHQTVIFGQPGPLTSRISELGLEFLPAPPVRRRPSAAVVSEMCRIADARGIDIVHGYEWPPALEAFLTSRKRPGLVAVATVMSMAVAPFLPRSMPVLVGTEQICASVRQAGRSRSTTLEPPIDMQENAPRPPKQSSAFRAEYGIPPDGMIVVAVSRLAREMKLEGLLTAVEAVSQLPPEHRVTLIIAGDGPARAEVAARAEAVNAKAGRTVALLTGELADPRPAYACADVILGMGGSALKGLAFAKPVIVQGERGFWRLVDDESIPQFLWTGWYGVGSDPGSGVESLLQELTPLICDSALRLRLGRLGRQLVERRFSLDAAATSQIAVYEAALNLPASPVADRLDFVSAAAKFLRYRVGRKINKAAGRASVDDFNSRPVIADHRAPARDRSR